MGSAARHGFEQEADCLVHLLEAVVGDEHVEALQRLARREAKHAARGRVVAALARRAARSPVADRGRGRGVAEALDADGLEARALAHVLVARLEQRDGRDFRVPELPAYLARGEVRAVDVDVEESGAEVSRLP